MSYKGKFRPKNPQKYKGNPTNIIYRSLWECKFMSFLDSHPDIVEWSSEEMIIPYISPLDNKAHRYFPDFVVKKKTKEGLVETLVVEIKPDKQTKPPEVQKKVTRTYLNEVKTWAINKAKWDAANQFCLDRKWKFVVFTEHHLGIKF
jgi:hypothetical protein